MAQWDNYSQKSAPADTDTLMLKDNAATGKPNKRLLFSGLWTWIVDKLTNAVINNLTTTPKTVVGGMNNLQEAVTTLNSKLFKQLGANLSDEAFNALTADGLYVGYIPTTSCPCKQQWAYINVKSLSANANDVIQEVVGITSAITCTRMKSSGTWGDWVLAPTRAEVDALNLNYTSSADDIAGAVRGWIDAAVAKGKSGFYSGNLTWSGHFSGLVVANVHVVSPARVTFLCIPQVGNNAGKHLTATLDGNSFQIYEFEGSRIL